MFTLNNSVDFIYFYLFFFFIYTFFGWCLEVTYSAVSTGRFVNRGFLSGPVCPVYGFGSIFVILILNSIKENALLLFIGSIVITTVLEFITGFILEKVFHQRLWNYSSYPFNIKGYVCLKFSLAWGIGCLLLVKIIHPLIAILLSIIPKIIGVLILAIFIAVFTVDVVNTVLSLLKLNVRLKQIDEISMKIKSKSDSIGLNISEDVLELKDKYEKLVQQRNLFNARLIKAFPDIRSTRYFEALEDIKNHIQKISNRK